ncbi:MAG TPA: helix-turn-helix transcriptional regulator [Gaiellaceae bacterium]|nr:helix-turn-helix transcriptional regulator [Gaiellaceae bacterium]
MSVTDTTDLLRDAPLKLIAARIARARKHTGLSLDRLADAADTSRQHLINLEKGRHRPRLEMLSRIAEATGKPVEYFLVEEAGEPNPFPEAA